MYMQLSQTEKLKQKKLRAKVIVFAITCLASFCFFALFWPLLVKGYESQTGISIKLQPHDGNTQEFQTLLANALRSRTQEPFLKDLIRQVEMQTPLRNQLFIDSQAGQIRKSMSVRTEQLEVGSLQVRLIFRGLGSADERLFLRKFADELSISLVSLAANSPLADDLEIQSVVGVRFRKKLEQIENDLVQLQRDLSGGSEWYSGNSKTEMSSKPFRQAAHSNATLATNGLSALPSASLLDRINQVDFPSLYAQLEELQDFISKEGINSYDHPVALNAISMAPIGGTPHPKQLFILLVMAVAAGLLTAINFDPFAQRGFESLNRLANALRVPIVATLPINQVTAAEALSSGIRYRKIPWANYLVQMASVFLSCFFAVVIGFCLLSAEVRQSFLENPFHGMTHVVWFLLGY